MIRFGHYLKEIGKSENLTQKELAAKIGVDEGVLSRWLSGKALPDRAVLAKVLKKVHEDQAPQLLMTWVYDSIPQADRIVTITPRDASAKVKEGKDEWPAGLPKATRQKFIDFSRVASENPDVMQIVEVIHKAATRMWGKGGK